MKDNFNIYQWRREYLAENESKEIGTYYNRPGKFKGKDYDGYVRLYSNTSNEEVKAAFTKKGYIEIGFDNIDDDDRGTLVYVYYKKK
jgi:hypothetical protein